jgi:hypothetical protein
VTTDVCASTAESDRFLCKICPGTIQLDVNPVSYFILLDRRTYQRHESAPLATDTVELYTSCKNTRIFTEVNIFHWENMKYEFRGCGKSIDLTSGNYYVDSARCSPCRLLTDVVSGKKDVITWNAQTHIMTSCIGLHFVLEQARYAKGVFMSTIRYLRQTQKEKQTFKYSLSTSAPEHGLCSRTAGCSDYPLNYTAVPAEHSTERLALTLRKWEFPS